MLSVSTVCVYLVRRRGVQWEVLLLGRHRERGARWVGAGGIVEQGETAVEAARREVAEETGLDVGSTVVALDQRYSFERGGKEFHEEVFWTEAPPGWEPVLDPREHDGYRWWSVDEAVEQIAAEP